jgi:hypothetical protein
MKSVAWTIITTISRSLRLSKIRLCATKQSLQNAIGRLGMSKEDRQAKLKALKELHEARFAFNEAKLSPGRNMQDYEKLYNAMVVAYRHCRSLGLDVKLNG